MFCIACVILCNCVANWRYFCCRSWSSTPCLITSFFLHFSFFSYCCLSLLQEIQPQEWLLAAVQRRKLQYFGHVVRARNLCTEILEGRIDGKRRRGRPMRTCTDGVKDWSNRSVAECSRLARDRPQWRLLVHEMISDPQLAMRNETSKQAYAVFMYVIYIYFFFLYITVNKIHYKVASCVTTERLYV